MVKGVLKLKMGDVVADDDGNPWYVVLEEPKDRGNGEVFCRVLYTDGGPGVRGWLTRSVSTMKVNVPKTNMEAVEKYNSRDNPDARANRAAEARRRATKPKRRTYRPGTK